MNIVRLGIKKNKKIEKENKNYEQCSTLKCSVEST